MNETTQYENNLPGVEQYEIARNNFDAWNKALQTGDATQVAGLYTKETTFLPTMSGDFKKGQTDAAEYFKHFLEKAPVGEVIEEKVQMITPGCYIHSGMYNFELGPKDKREIARARFTFVWEKNKNGDWKIIHHHSSVKP